MFVCFSNENIDTSEKVFRHSQEAAATAAALTPEANTQAHTHLHTVSCRGITATTNKQAN